MAAASKKSPAFREDCLWNFSRTYKLLSVDLNFDISTLSALKTFYYFYKKLTKFFETVKQAVALPELRDE